MFPGGLLRRIPLILGCLTITSLIILSTFSAVNTFIPPVYQIDTFPSGDPEISYPHQGVYDSFGGRMLVAEYGTKKFFSVKYGNRHYFAGSDELFSFDLGGIEGPATSAVFKSPGGVWGDTSGNIFVSDRSGARIKRVTGDGKIENYAGCGVDGQTGDGGPATSATIYDAAFLFGDYDGNIYFVESAFSFVDGRIRHVSRNSGIISTVVGGGRFVEDGFSATSTGIHGVAAVFVNAQGDIFWTIGSTGQVQMMSSATQLVTTIAGGGALTFSTSGVPNSGSSIANGVSSLSLNLHSPHGIWGDTAGNLFVVETDRGNVVLISRNANYKTAYLAASGLIGAISVSVDDSTGKVYVVQTGFVNALKVLTDVSIITTADTTTSVGTTTTTVTTADTITATTVSKFRLNAESGGFSLRRRL